MYSTYNEGKSVVAERFIRTIKNKIFKHVSAASKNVYFDVLNDIDEKYNKTCHRTIKMKPTNTKPDSYDEYSIESNEKHPKFQADYRDRISKYKNNFAKGYAPNWSEEGFAVSKIKKKVPWAYAISDLNSEEVNVTFWEK